MKIAGVSVDLENLPTRKQMYDLAINTNEFNSEPLRDEKINKILDDSGLWKIEEENGLHTAITEKVRKGK